VACLEVLGDKVSRTFKGLVRFAKELGGYLETPAISALELHKGKDRVGEHTLPSKSIEKGTKRRLHCRKLCLPYHGQSKRNHLSRECARHKGLYHLQSRECPERYDGLHAPMA